MISFELWKQPDIRILVPAAPLYTPSRKELHLKKKEFIFIIAILVSALLLWGAMFLIRKGDYGSVRITVNGEEYGTYSLSQDQVISIGETNVCEIKDGSVHMIHATCPDKLCIKQKAIDKNGGSIICLPNKVMIEGEKTAELDAVT